MIDRSPAPNIEEQTPAPAVPPFTFTFPERVGAGTVAAFVYALLGGALWLGLHYLDFWAWLGAIVAVRCAVKGYENFARRQSFKGIVLATVMALLVVSIVWYLCLSADVYQTQIEWFEAGKTGYRITFWDAVAGAYTRLLDPVAAWAGWRDLVIGGALCVADGILSMLHFRALLKDIEKHGGQFVDGPEDVFVDPPHVFMDPPQPMDDL